MTITLYAQPYSISAQGFYFASAQEYETKQQKLLDIYGNTVEEFEIQFIDGEDIDCQLAKAIGLDQGNFRDFLDCAHEWEDWQKTKAIIALGECGYDFDPKANSDEYDIDVYQVDSLRALAEQFIDEGLFGEIPEQLQHYIDYDAIARDLGMDYTEVIIAGERLVYRVS